MSGKSFKGEKETWSPYRRAKQVWDDRLGTAKEQARIWRIFGLSMLGVVALSVAGLIYQSSKSRIEPYIVEVGAQKGEVRLVGRPRTQEYEPREGVVRHFLQEWIRNVRAVSGDKEVVRADLLDAYASVVGSASGRLDELMSDEKPFELKGRREVDFQTYNKLSEDSYRVEWVERRYTKDGYLQGKKRIVGVFGVKRRVPRTAEELEKNPLGLFVSHFSLNQESLNRESEKEE